MAIYQYHLLVVPRKAILAKWDITPEKIQVHDNPALEEDDLINVKWWTETQIDYDTIESKILKFASKVEWTNEYLDWGNYGDDDTNDISISKSELGFIDEFSFRIDLREIDNTFIINLMSILNELDSLLIDRQGNLFEPNAVQLYENIKKSNSFKFVTNPSDFFEKLSSGEINPE